MTIVQGSIQYTTHLSPLSTAHFPQHFPLLSKDMGNFYSVNKIMDSFSMFIVTDKKCNFPIICALDRKETWLSVSS